MTAIKRYRFKIYVLGNIFGFSYIVTIVMHIMQTRMLPMSLTNYPALGRLISFFIGHMFIGHLFIGHMFVHKKTIIYKHKILLSYIYSRVCFC